MNWRIIIMMATIFFGCDQHSSTELPDLSWNGGYEYVEEIPGDMPRGWQFYTTGKSEGKLDVLGRQVGFSARCRLKIEAEKMEVYYMSEIDMHDPMSNKLKEGDLLFTLKREGGKLKTEWGKVSPYYTMGGFSKVK